MTREELRDYVDEQRTLNNIPYHVYSALIDGIDTLEQEPRWIPCSERLPEANRAVLTYVDTGATKTYCLADWNGNCIGWEEWIGTRLIEKEMGYKILAWMPLPKAYREVEE